MEEKLKKCFEGMVVKKVPGRSKFFSASLSLPSFMRDWLVMRFANENGDINTDDVVEYVHRYIPRREEWHGILKDLMDGIRAKFLAKVRVKADMARGEWLFSLPDFGYPSRAREAVIDAQVVERSSKHLFGETEAWGIVELVWYKEDFDDEDSGRVHMVDFKPFCPYQVELDYFQEARKEFTVEEWTDVILSAIDYNPFGFLNTLQKTTLINRLLPFVEKRVNLIELAPKETGKSYLFSQISKYGWLVSGGSVTRAKLFYDNSKRTEGLIKRYDYVALDEIQSIKFNAPEEIQGALKGYLESDAGEFRVGDYHGYADAGFILLGNIDDELMDENRNMFRDLPLIFHEAALLDRFHGFIRGWDIPKMKGNMVANGWALNVEYFSEIMHALRSEILYGAIVDEVLDVPKSAGARDTKSIKRICSALLKLYFPHVRDASDLEKDEFNRYCLEPAKQMRRIIRKQLHIINPGEYAENIPDIQYEY